jgi:hypothetical protein
VGASAKIEEAVVASAMIEEAVGASAMIEEAVVASAMIEEAVGASAMIEEAVVAGVAVDMRRPVFPSDPNTFATSSRLVLFPLRLLTPLRRLLTHLSRLQRRPPRISGRQCLPSLVARLVVVGSATEV